MNAGRQLVVHVPMRRVEQVNTVRRARMSIDTNPASGCSGATSLSGPGYVPFLSPSSRPVAFVNTEEAGQISLEDTYLRLAMPAIRLQAPFLVATVISRSAPKGGTQVSAATGSGGGFAFLFSGAGPEKEGAVYGCHAARVTDSPFAN